MRRNTIRVICSAALSALVVAGCQSDAGETGDTRAEPGAGSAPGLAAGAPAERDHAAGSAAQVGPSDERLVGWRGKGPDAVEIGRGETGRADFAERVRALVGWDPFRAATAAGEIATGRGLQRELRERAARAGDEPVVALVIPSLPAQPRVEEHLRGLGARFVRLVDRNVYAIKAPAAALERASRDPLVYWIGQAPPERKVDPLLARHLDGAPAAGDDPVEPGAVIALYDPDDVRAVRGALESMGVEVERYDADIAAFVARLDARQAARAAALEEVAFIDARRVAHTNLDTSVDRCGNLDYVRDTFTYGAGVIVGMIDSGFEVNHDAFVGWSPLPPLYALAWNVSGEGDVWDDNPSGHGTHVAGIMMSRWRGPNIVGVAPRAAGDADHRFRVVRAGRNTGPSNALYSLDTAMDALANDNAAQVINCSWSHNGSSGTDATSVKADTIAWNNGQIFVYSAGNDGPNAGSIDSPAAAKNVIAVGSVDNTSSVPRSSFSSQGPTADSRGKPDIFAVGGAVTSANAGNLHGSVDFSGTSMAAPHVSGFLAGLIDHYGSFSRRPALAKSYLMASATRRSDLPSRTGLLNGYQAHFSTATTWGNWGWRDDDARPYAYTYWDIDVPSGVTEMTVVLSWIEPAPAIGATNAVLNDVDLYVDYQRDQNGYGEWGSSGIRDNVEYVRIVNPPAGPYRISARNYSAPTLYKAGYSVFFRK